MTSRDKRQALTKSQGSTRPAGLEFKTLNLGVIRDGAFSPRAVLLDGSVIGTHVSRTTGQPLTVRKHGREETTILEVGRVLAASESGWFVTRSTTGDLIAAHADGSRRVLQQTRSAGTFHVTSVNAHGHAVGSYTSKSGEQMAVQWQGDLPEPLSPLARTGEAVTDSGRVFGLTHAGDLYASAPGQSLVTVPTNSAQVWVNGVDSFGQVAGVIYRACQDMMGFVWSPSEGWIELTEFEGTRSCLVGINDLGWTFGYGTQPDGRMIHFLWRAGHGVLEAQATVLGGMDGWKLQGLSASNRLGMMSGLAQSPEGTQLFVAIPQ